MGKDWLQVIVQRMYSALLYADILSITENQKTWANQPKHHTVLPKRFVICMPSLFLFLNNSYVYAYSTNSLKSPNMHFMNKFPDAFVIPSTVWNTKQTLVNYNNNSDYFYTS